MVFDEGFQHGNQIVIAYLGLAASVHILCLDLTGGIHNQLIGKAGTGGIGLAVLIAVHHVVIVVDHGFGDHNGLLALGQEDGVIGVIHAAGEVLRTGNKVLEVHQNVAVAVELVQNLTEFLHGYKIPVVHAAQLRICKGADGILNEHMEGKVGDGVDILPLHQLGFGVQVFGLLGGELLLDRGIVGGKAVQGGHGAVIVVLGGLDLCSLQQLLIDGGNAVRLLAGLERLGLFLCLFQLSQLQTVGQGACHKAHNQNKGHKTDDGGQIGLLEDLHFGRTAASLPAAVFIHGFGLRIFPAVDGLHVPVQEFGEKRGLVRLFALLLLPLGQLGKAELLLFPGRLRRNQVAVFVILGLSVVGDIGIIAFRVLSVGVILPFGVLGIGVVFPLGILGVGVILPFGVLGVGIAFLFRIPGIGVIPVLRGTGILGAVASLVILLSGEEQVLVKASGILPCRFAAVRGQELGERIVLVCVQGKITESILPVFGIELAQIQILLRLRSVKIVGPAVFLFKIKIDVKIVGIHGISLPYGIVTRHFIGAKMALDRMVQEYSIIPRIKMQAKLT